MTTSPADESPDLQERIAALIGEGDIAALETLLEEFHPSDIADVVESLSEDLRLALVRALPADLASETLAEMEEGDVRAELLSALAPAEGAELLHELSDDDAADLVGELAPETQDRLLAELPTDEAGDIRELLQYDEDTAGGIMTTALVSVLGHLTAGEAIEAVRVKGREVENFYTVFVVDEDTKLLGTVPLDDLILSDTDHRISDLVEPTVASVVPEADQEQVGHMIAHYNLASIPVVSDEGVLLGRVTFDDVIDVIEAESTEDLLLFSGVSEAEELRGSSLEAVRARLPWLLLNTMTASLAASVVWWFRSEIAAATLLAVVMPVVAGLGGNAGQQALAVTIRRLATSAGPLEARGRVVRKEILVGFLNGGAIGLLVAVGAGMLALAMGVDPRLGVVVLLAMWGNIAMAGFAGSFIPTVLDRMGQDPAVASTVFLTALTDLTGFLLLLGLATVML
ncbi:MAG: magnesium transporter [Gemmatimonadetes bacterium]|nr:magnesium transporter [Gemmatimonadota bacterium]